MKKQARELLQYNNELDKKITSENDKVLTDIICYLRGSHLSEYHQELVRQDLLEMVISAQQRGEDIQTVIGADYKEFCDNVIASMPPQSMKERVLDFLDIIFLCTAVFWGFNIALLFITDNIIRNKPFRYEVDISFGTFVSYILSLIMAYTIAQIFFKTSLRNKKEKKHSKGRIIAINFLTGAGIMAILLLAAWIGRGVFFSINIFAAAALLILFYALHRLLAYIAGKTTAMYI